MSSISEIAQKYVEYSNNVKYPESPKHPNHNVGESHQDYGKRLDEYEQQKAEYKKAVAEYRKLIGSLECSFKAAVLFELGLKDHPRADLLWEMAWERGHSGGYVDVAIYAEGLVDLLK